MTALPKVLIVEDDLAIRGMLAAALGRQGLAVDGAGDGIIALEMLAAASYAVIVVDLMMPRMDGFAFLDAFAKLDLPLRPLIFVMTAYDDAALLKLNGTLVHGYLRKPFDVEQVVKIIRDAAETLHAVEKKRVAAEPAAALSADTVSDAC
ncbi:MAG TPA: response regulator [Thermoanaerobaculia bacterium]|nr:response regulator [Thermoanaerobaculia bacterium]